ncbi:MAG: N-6 DNA methylase [Acidimicrobiales bacterium]
MAGDQRARELARFAAGLATGAGIELPDSLALWRLGGGRPTAEPVHAADPARHLGEALEAHLTAGERRLGAHYTPAAVADRVAALVLDGAPARATVVDPTCGGGAMLLAAGRHIAATGLEPADIARDLLWGADLDPLAVAVTEAAIALWAGVAPPAGHLVVADTLHEEPWMGGFDVVVGNPPFQGQLGRATTRPARDSERLRQRFGGAVTPYVDTAALFLLVGVGLVRVGGRVALIQPLSTVASRDAGAVRAALAGQARLVELWAPDARLFEANVHVCVPVLETSVAGEADWAGRLAAARGVPATTLAGRGTLADLAEVVAGFRDEYYGLVGHVREAPGQPAAPLVTCGLIGLGSSAWGAKPVRFAKQRWARPDVDVDAARQASTRIGSWLERVQRPKVVVASQTRVLEGAADREGTWVPSTPALSVVPTDPADVDRVAAVLCAPPVAAWALRRAVGTGLSPDAIRVSAGLLADVPLPTGARAWATATSLLADGDLEAFGVAATAMYDLPRREAAAVERWWGGRRPR